MVDERMFRRAVQYYVNSVYLEGMSRHYRRRAFRAMRDAIGEHADLDLWLRVMSAVDKAAMEEDEQTALRDLRAAANEILDVAF
ncbi:MAG: hypothetical protein DRI61_15095 [Chloroflexi bacterium]|nr:MAG: hypothetical protein DRI61_15095 [Chloroflexota bacterium]